VLVVGVVIAATVAVVATRTLRRFDVVLLLLPVALLFAIVVSGTWGQRSLTGDAAAAQGRYLYAGLIGATTVVAIGLVVLMRRRVRFAPLAVAIGALVLHGWMIVTQLRWFWMPPADRGGIVTRVRGSVASMRAWATLPDAVAVGVVVLLVVATVSLMIALTRFARVGIDSDVSSGNEGQLVTTAWTP
jgi:hypothetical protein